MTWLMDMAWMGLQKHIVGMNGAMLSMIYSHWVPAVMELSTPGSSRSYRDSRDLPVEYGENFGCLLRTLSFIYWKLSSHFVGLTYCQTYCLELLSNINPHFMSLFSGLWYSIPCKRWTLVYLYYLLPYFNHMDYCVTILKFYLFVTNLSTIYSSNKLYRA